MHCYNFKNDATTDNIWSVKSGNTRKSNKECENNDTTRCTEF